MEKKDQKISAIIVDDMPLALSSLKADLEASFSQIEILDTAEGVVSGAKKINALHPDLIFLDIEMQDGDGFDLLDLIQSPKPKVIFTTASDNHAIKAFQYAAIDYLLKPIDQNLLGKAIDRVVNSIGNSDDQYYIAQKVMKNEDSNKLALNTQQELKIIDIKDIIRCESYSNYTTFFLESKEKIVVTKPLKEYDQILKDKGFIRPHQSHLVNTYYIESYQKADGGYLLLQDESMVPVSVRKRSMVMDSLKTL